MRVIADHIRTIAFSITDGQLPSNAKAGYVIRRILRRAVRYGYTFLNQKGAFMYKLIPALIDTMGDAYPELSAQQSLVEKVIKEEEESFLRTLETGIRLLDKIMADTKAAGKSEISGNDGFTLYDTFGFPLDLTELILRENKLTLNLAEFDTAMAAQKERARNAAAVETGDWVVIKEGEPQFIGYDLLESDVEILRYRKVKQKNQELYQVVFDKSPFYAEMGGQMGDSGYIESNGVRYEIIDTKKENNLSIHILKSMPQDVSSIFYAVVDKDKRQQTACNHTATHILDYALRSVLGTHVEQKGSMVSSTVLRFDFSHFQKVTDEELRQVERLANSMVRQNIPLTEYRDIPIEQARTMGAMALFGEKYGDTVRVIQYGPSMELCGGTHVQATGEIGTIRIISESSVAAGIRRIEAVSAAQAEELLYVKEDLLRDMKNFFNNTPNLLASVKKTIEENADLKKQVESYYQEKILNLRDHLLAQAKVVNGVKLVVIKGEFSADMVKSVAFQIKNVSSEPLAVLGATYSQDKKPSLTVLLSEELVEKGMNATQIVRDAAKEIQGGGGGQPFFAQAGGKKFDGLNSALDKLMALFV